MNKFKIRELKNQRRMLDKQIAKLEEQEEIRLNSEVIATIKEKGVAKVVIDGKPEEEIVLHNINIDFKIYNREITCTITDRRLPYIIAVGKSKCRKGEPFNKRVGISIAEYRAREQYYKLMTQEFIENL